MQLERLVIDSGEHTFTADFHPRLSVIGGLDAPARAALAGELIDSLAGAKPGVHLELRSRGRSLTVFRPSHGRHRVIDTDSVADVTDDHLGSDGAIDLFAAMGVDRALARHAIRLTPDDLVLRGASDQQIARLAAADQEQLWQAAAALERAEKDLLDASGSTGASPTDVALVNAVEERHAALVAATDAHERFRLASLTLADLGAIAGLAMAFGDRPGTALPFLFAAMAGVFLALWSRRKVARAEEAERVLLSSTGAEDYAAFQLERVNALLEGDTERRRFMEAVTEHRHAVEGWESVAGDSTLAFALEHADQIRLSADVHTGVRSLQFLSETAPAVSADVTAELAQALLNRIEAVRALTPGPDMPPLVVDDALEHLEPTVKPMLLEMLAASAGSPQVIVLTGDDDVESWARVEAMTGELAVIEPQVRPAAAPSSSSSPSS